MPALGESFRTARESQGLSLSEVADRIHIRSGYLAAIETEDWQAIGPAVYVRGFVRNYARFLGLDADAAVAHLADGSPGTTPLVAGRPVTSRAEPSRSGLSTRGLPQRSGASFGEAPKRGPSIWAVLSVLVAVCLVVFVGYEYLSFRQTTGGRSSETHSQVVALTPPASSGDVSPAGAVAKVPPRTEFHAPSKNAIRSSGFTVQLKEGSWLRVTIDGKVEMEGLYPSGTSRSFGGRSATIRAGNAGGVTVFVDGKDRGPMGGLGDVAEHSFQL